MAAPKRTKFQREQDLESTAQMYLTGRTQQEIADRLNVSQGQVSRDLATITARWRASTAINLDEVKQRELARLDELERTHWAAWERSLQRRTKTRTGRSAGVAWASAESETSTGNAAYLAGVQDCISQRCKLLGLYANVKQDVNLNVDLSKLTDEELLAIIES